MKRTRIFSYFLPMIRSRSFFIITRTGIRRMRKRHEHQNVMQNCRFRNYGQVVMHKHFFFLFICCILVDCMLLFTAFDAYVLFTIYSRNDMFVHESHMQYALHICVGLKSSVEAANILRLIIMCFHCVTDKLERCRESLSSNITSK